MAVGVFAVLGVVVVVGGGEWIVGSTRALGGWGEELVAVLEVLADG